MMDVQAQALSDVWKERLDLSGRGAGELFEDARDVGRSAHAGAIRTTLEELGASGVFCVQDVPTVVIVELSEYDRQLVVNLHGALWNQGLATLMLVLSDDTVRVFSLARTPVSDEGAFDVRCLVRQLDAVTDALAVGSLIYATESGRLWDEHAEFFRPTERVDQVLLDNLTAAHEALCSKGLSAAGAQALLIQTMFVAYLEDREIIGPDYVLEATDGEAKSFGGLLEGTNARGLYRLFESLREDFNGDLFVAPCAFEASVSRERVLGAHLATLAAFRSGHEEMRADGGQLRFWGYNFKYIPIELVSAVYDRFLGARKAERRKRGAYYTPMFLADTVIGSLWDVLPDRTKARGSCLDPACGSGVFLVRLFQRQCEHWRRTHRLRTIRWDSLLAMLSRLHGCDVDDGAVRVAVFSLYVALLQEVDPPDIRRLMQRRRLLPELWGRTLRAQDFFDGSETGLQADVVIGNPPWTSRRAPDRSSIAWCAEHDLPMPGNEGAWGFVWKSLRHLRAGGVMAFLLPAMGFLHNHSPVAVKAREELARTARLLRIVNFADLRFQLFEGAVRPAALMIMGRGTVDGPGYRFDYWAPKADLNLRMGRMITLSSADKGSVTSRQVGEDSFVFKRRLWMNDPEAKLFGYLRSLPSLGERVIEYRKVYRKIDSFVDRWVVGNGFQPVNDERLGEEGYRSERSEIVPNVPYLPIGAFRVLAQGRQHLGTFDDGHGGTVRRKGFERGFDGPRVLVPRGIRSGDRRLRASYVDVPLAFEDILLAVSVPADEATGAKLLTALLSSKLLFWFTFHGTASFGSERPEVKQSELLRLPLPALEDVSSEGHVAAKQLVSIIDEARRRASQGFLLESGDEDLLHRLDGLCYRYFGLGDEEIAVVEDAVDNVIPCAQPHRGSSVDLWRAADRSDREAYASTLVASLTPWFDENAIVNVVLEACNDDLALLRLRLMDPAGREPYLERDIRDVGKALRGLAGQLNVPLPGNFQLVPDFRLFAGDSLYLVKPLQRRFWLRSAAIADADAVAADLQDAGRFGEVGEPA